MGIVLRSTFIYPPQREFQLIQEWVLRFYDTVHPVEGTFSLVLNGKGNVNRLSGSPLLLQGLEGEGGNGFGSLGIFSTAPIYPHLYQGLYNLFLFGLPYFLKGRPEVL